MCFVQCRIECGTWFWPIGLYILWLSNGMLLRSAEWRGTMWRWRVTAHSTHKQQATIQQWHSQDWSLAPSTLLRWPPSMEIDVVHLLKKNSTRVRMRAVLTLDRPYSYYVDMFQSWSWAVQNVFVVLFVCNHIHWNKMRHFDCLIWPNDVLYMHTW